MTGRTSQMIVLGRVSGLFGVQGWIKVYSYTDPREGIAAYRSWYLRCAEQWQRFELLEGRRHGKTVLARLEGVGDRDQARALVGAEIAVRRDQLPPLETGEYYWSDLIGLRVVTRAGQDLGVVDHWMETGANDVLVVRGERERLIPFIRDQVVLEVDLEQGLLRVDWDPEF